MTGRRRIGKTSLVMKSIEGLPNVYLFVGRKSEATLCSEFIPVIAQSLNSFVPAEIRTFRTLFQYLMELASLRPFNLVIDEFQEFYNINESVYSNMQNIWDSYSKKSNMNLIGDQVHLSADAADLPKYQRAAVRAGRQHHQADRI